MSADSGKTDRAEVALWSRKKKYADERRHMVIDFHAHAFLDALAAGAVASLGKRANLTPFTDGTVSGTERCMREQGVDRFVVLNIAVNPRTERHVNDFAISLCKNPNIIPFGSVHPDSEHAFEELKRLKEAGIKGIKFHHEYQNFYADDEKAYPIYEKCAEMGFIMLYHGGADRGFTTPVKASPERIRRVWKAFPQAKIIAAHLGGQDMTEQAIESLLDTGVYIDTSFAALSVPMEQGKKVIRTFGSERVLFGSDCPWDTPANTLNYLQSMEFTEKEMEDICSRNALRLLGE